NWVSAVVTVLLAVLFAFLFVMDFDENPALVSINGKFLHIENKKGRVLWTKKLGLDLERIENKNIAKMIYRFENVNQDEFNELILCNEFFDNTTDTINPGRIVCFDYKGKQLWQYVFNDPIYAKGELQPLFYSTYLIDVKTQGNTKTLYAIAANSNFASAVFKLNASNGERIKNTLWNAGHFHDGIIGDFNKDGENEIVLTAINNGFERTMIVSIDLKNLTGQLPTTQNYLFHQVEEANYNKLVLLPVTDFAKFLGARFNITLRGGLRYLNNEFSLTTAEDITSNSPANVNYRFNYDLKFLDVECSDVFQIIRDSLVAKGQLEPPFTNTPEYELKLRNGIIYR
ncbi:MAG: hypothetical protein HXY50_03270, partial [Ignavibacteriaceae bacterium]|nr:hypothetical protein [Ignavibacteriaceae bacterium]